MPPTTTTTTTTSFSAESNNINKSPPITISQEDKFYSRLLSKESSVANPSFRVYYGGASGAVPFLWESQPGTPKNPIYDRTLPPLTPPPSYFSNFKSNKTPKRSTTNTKPNLITTILPKLSLKKTQSHSSIYTSSSSNSSTSPSISSNSSSSSSSASVGPQSRRARLSSPRSSFSSRGDEYDSDEGSPTSTLCFCSARHVPGGRARGNYKSVMGMKNALLSIVGHGSSG